LQVNINLRAILTQREQATLPDPELISLE
jgi:hypothetical protein